jgi:ChrR Cupin-like domain
MARETPGRGAQVLQDSLAETIVRLLQGPQTSEVKRLLISARRLQAVTQTWRAIPPHDEARREMVAKVSHIAESARTVTDRPPPMDEARVTPKVGRTSERKTEVAPGIVITRPDAMEWRPFPFGEGISVKVLHRDPVARSFTALVRMAPGTRLPRHRHAANEQIYLLEGSASLGEVSARAGEFCHAFAGTVHESFTTDVGCTFFLIGSEADELLVDCNR